MCGAVMRGAVALPGSEATSRTKGARWNLGDLVWPAVAVAIRAAAGRRGAEAAVEQARSRTSLVVLAKRPNKAAMSGGGGRGGKGASNGPKTCPLRSGRGFPLRLAAQQRQQNALLSSRCCLCALYCLRCPASRHPPDRASRRRSK